MRTRCSSLQRVVIAAAGIPEGFHSGLPWWGAARGAEARGHATPTGLGSIALGLGASMLVCHLILVEHLGHVVSDRIPVVGHRHEGDLFAGFRVLVAGLRFGSLGLLGVLRSAHSHQYTSITSR